MNIKQNRNHSKKKLSSVKNISKFNSPSLLKPQLPIFNTTQKILSQNDNKVNFKEIKKSNENKSFDENNHNHKNNLIDIDKDIDKDLDSKSPFSEKPINIVYYFINYLILN